MSLEGFVDKIVARYEAQAFQEAVGARDDNMRLALNLPAGLAEVAKATATPRPRCGPGAAARSSATTGPWARGDILTVVIEIDDSAQISNSTDASRDGSTSMEIGALFSVPEALEDALPDGVASGVELGGGSDFSGDGSVRRAEELTLRVAATVTDILPNGVLAIAGSQEVRVNNELRELLVSGFVRPADVSRQNEVEYDRIAQARISYGGRGTISDAQAPRVGQAALDRFLPF